MDDPKPDSASPKPQPGLLKTVGILNLIFGGALLLGGLGWLNATASVVVRGVPLRIEPSEMQAVFDELRNEQLRNLREQETSAASAAERERLKAERVRVEGQHIQVKDQVDFPKMNAGLSSLGDYLRLDVPSGLVLNMLLVISGFGLVLRKNWARVLCIATAALKIVRLVALTGLLVGSVIPRLSESLDVPLRHFLTQAIELQRAQQGTPPAGPMPTPEEMVRALKGVGTGFVVFAACFGGVYPIIVVVLLSRPGARAGCRTGESPTAGDTGF